MDFRQFSFYHDKRASGAAVYTTSICSPPYQQAVFLCGLSAFSELVGPGTSFRVPPILDRDTAALALRQETVECDITINSFEGTVLTQPQTYTIKKSILVERPQITAMGTSGNVEVLQNTQGNYGLPTTDWLLQAGSITQNVPGAMHTQVTVTMPPDFASLGNGSTSIQQFIEPEEFIEKTVNGPQIAGNCNNELYALDGGDFYNWTTTNTTGTVTTFSTQDSPYIDLTYFNATFGKLASTFEDYILWQPPEINTNYATCYMPLQDLTWNLDAAATEPTDKNGDPTGWTFANAGTVNITANYHNTQALPEWKQIVPSGNSFD